MAIEFPSSGEGNGADPKTNGAKPETTDASLTAADETAAPESAKKSGAGSFVLGVLLVAALVASGWLWSERQTLVAQVTDLNAQIEAAAAREAEVQTGIGDIAGQLEALQVAVGSLLGDAAADAPAGEAEALDAVGEAAAPAITESAQAPATDTPTQASDGGVSEFSWTERALESAGPASEPASGF